MAEHDGALEGGRLLVAISDAMVGLFREFLGKGPERCKTHWAGRDMVVVLLDGGYTIAERTLYEAGRGAAVQKQRQALHQALEVPSKAIIEELTGRRVVAFLSASHQDPDLSAELFLLESQNEGGLAALASEPSAAE